MSTQTAMIQLTRLNNMPLMLNSDLIKFVEQSPDTVITLINNEKILVRENADAVLGRIVQFRRALLSQTSSGSSVPFAIHDKPVDPMPRVER